MYWQKKLQRNVEQNMIMGYTRKEAQNLAIQSLARKNNNYAKYLRKYCREMSVI